VSACAGNILGRKGLLGYAAIIGRLRLDEQQSEQAPSKKRCSDVFDAFLKHCEMRVAMNDLAYSTFNGYRKLLDAVWRPAMAIKRLNRLAIRILT
jgi:hypothetical protein